MVFHSIGGETMVRDKVNKSDFLQMHKIFYFIYFIFFAIGYIFFFLYNIVLVCHTSTCICHGCTRVPHPESPSHLLPHITPLDHPSAPALSILYHASNLDWKFISHMIIYMFQCHFPKPSLPRPLSHSPEDCSIHQCLFCCLAYRIIFTIFLNSIYMH